MLQPTEEPSLPASASQAASQCQPGEGGRHIAQRTPRYFDALLLRHRDQALFALASTLALISMVIYCCRTGGCGRAPIELDRQSAQELSFAIDLNTSTWVEWSQLPGIGPVLARRIVDERDARGPYQSVDELMRVKGMGPKRIEAIRSFVRAEPPKAENPD